MAKFFFFLMFLTSLYSAEKSLWSQQGSFKLKKDEVANISVGVAVSEDTNQSSFSFRWTLVVNDRVTMLVNNNGYPTQHILYDKRSLDSLQFPLIVDGANRVEERSYLLLVLSQISEKKDEVDFNIFIKDDKQRILVSFGEPKDK